MKRLKHLPGVSYCINVREKAVTSRYQQMAALCVTIKIAYIDQRLTNLPSHAISKDDHMWDTARWIVTSSGQIQSYWC